jgi:hypothetical protein
MKTQKSKGKMGLTAYFVKQYLAIAPTGATAPLVYCLADDNMADEEIDVHEVPAGLLGLHDHDKSFVAFAKTRNINAAFTEWYWRHVQIPFSMEQREKHNLVGSTFSINCDGEDVQIDCFSNPAF